MIKIIITKYWDSIIGVLYTRHAFPAITITCAVFWTAFFAYEIPGDERGRTTALKTIDWIKEGQVENYYRITNEIALSDAERREIMLKFECDDLRREISNLKRDRRGIHSQSYDGSDIDLVEINEDLRHAKKKLWIATRGLRKATLTSEEFIAKR